MKISVISTSDKVPGTAETSVFYKLFITERTAKSQFKVRENTDLLFPFKLIESPELQVHGPQV